METHWTNLFNILPTVDPELVQRRLYGAKVVTGRKSTQPRKEYLKSYRRKNKDKDKMRKRAASRKMKAGKGKEVDHIDNNPKNNNRKNLKCVSRKKNRQKGLRKLILRDDPITPKPWSLHQANLISMTSSERTRLWRRGW